MCDSMKAPGCFGHITTCGTKPDICSPCEHYAACVSATEKRVDKLRALNIYPDIETLLPDATEALSAPEPKVEMVATTRKRGTMTKKATETYEALVRKGVDLKAGLMGNFNPVPGKPKFVYLAFEMLLEAGGYSKRELKEYYKRNLGWGEGTAASHSGMVTSIFSGLGLVAVDKDSVKVVAPDKSVVSES